MFFVLSKKRTGVAIKCRIKLRKNSISRVICFIHYYGKEKISKRRDTAADQSLRNVGPRNPSSIRYHNEKPVMGDIENRSFCFAQIAKGDKEAFDLFFRQYYPKLLHG